MRSAGGGAGVLRRGVPTFSPVPSPLHSQVCHRGLRPALGKVVSRTGVEEGGFPGSCGVNSREDKTLEADMETSYDDR